jgi:hypothetical protein
MKTRISQSICSAAPLVLLAACGPASPPAPTAVDARATAPAAMPAAEPAGNRIVMKVDGVEWSADREIFCTVAPPSLGGVLIVSGSRGPKDAHEQTFNLNLSGVQGPGTLKLAGGGSTTHAIQLANLDDQRHLNGGALGFDVTVEVLAFVRDPAQVDLRFSGTLNSSSGKPLRIEDGHARCSE